MVNFFIIVFLIVYIIQWRRRHHHSLMAVNLESPTSGTSTMMSNGSVRKKSWNGSAANNNRGYSPVKSGQEKLNVPFHDYESSSDDELFRKRDDELFRKPFSDHQ